MAPKNEQLEYIQNPGFEGGVFKLGRNYQTISFLSISSIFSIVKQLSQETQNLPWFSSPKSPRSEAKNPWRNRCFPNSHGLLGRRSCPSLGFEIQEEPLNNKCI